MILRWLETLNHYNFVVQFRNGKKHGNAATLSRCGHGGEPSELDEYERKEAIYHIRPKMSIRNNISELGDLIIANIMYPEQMMRAEIRQAQITDADTSKVRMWLERAGNLTEKISGMKVLNLDNTFLSMKLSS